jgi:hypothetical protein
MSVTTFEGIVENGVIRLPESVRLPERAKVYVVVPDPDPRQPLRIASPRLVHPEQAADLLKVVVEESRDAGV